MKKNYISGTTLFLIFFFAASVQASWLIDPLRFSFSSHAQHSCQDCHQEITEKNLHPDPVNVTKKLSDFFTVERCTSCHDDILDHLNQGSHGSIKIKSPKGYEDCLRCHDPHYPRTAEKRPQVQAESFAFSEADQACLVCHAAIQAADPESSRAVVSLCFQCHARGDAEAQRITARSVGPIEIDSYQAVAHADLSCLVCHPGAAGYEHHMQKPADCGQCHPRHDEKIAHDAHMIIACPACHLQDVSPVKELQTGWIVWQTTRNPSAPLKVHEMRAEDDPADCRRCHFRGNSVGAAAMVLPAKSVLCMPCHTATFSIGDTTTLIALAVFVFGIFMTFSYVLSGTIAQTNDSGLLPRFFILIGNGIKTVFSSTFIAIFKTLIVDVLMQRRLFERSFSRWAIHSLIFFPFVFRFAWGMFALLASLLKPELPWIWFMLDKNSAVTAFLFDLTGLMVLSGISLALIRGILQPDRPENLPNQDRAALALIGGIVIIGFVLEGLRITMTGNPPEAAYAFVGYGIHLLFAESQTVHQIYGYVWYLHAIATGAFVAYLPFSRLLHIIMAPIVLCIRSVAESEHAR